MATYYDAQIFGAGVNAIGRTLIQGSGTIGGTRSVFVKLQGSGKRGLVFPTTGGLLANPFPTGGKIFAGDLFEYNPNISDNTGATVKVLKTYEVATAAEGSTTVEIVRNGFRHIPNVGDILTVAPDSVSDTGTATTVTAVSKTTNDSGIQVWELTVSEAVTAEAGEFLVECDSDGNLIVTNPNAYAPTDYDLKYTAATGDDDFEGARYLLAPALANSDTILYTSKMTPLPACYLALNQSKVDGWFHL